jgi:hypothetical protein
VQFKVDENLPVEVKELLATAGHDTMTINDQKNGWEAGPIRCSRL